MYRILIVDDDVWIRTQIKNNYDLGSHGYCICGDASDGEKGLKLALELKPDIVITDMSMPNLNGVQLIERLNKVLPDIQIIVISNYDDFNYVSKSLKLKAVDYLLKNNLSQNLLLAALSVCVESIKQKEQLSTEFKNMERTNLLEQKIQRRGVLRQLITGNTNMDDSTTVNSTEFVSQIEFDFRNTKLLLVELDNYSSLEKRFSDFEMANLLNTITSLIENVLEKTNDSIVEHIYKGRFAILISYKDVNSQLFMIEATSRIISAIRSCLKKYMNLTACYVIGATCHRPDQIINSYDAAKKTIKRRFYTGIDSVLSDEWHEPVEATFFTLSQEDEQKITNALNEQDHDACIQQIKYIYVSLAKQSADPMSCKIISMELISIAKKYLSKYQKDTSVIDEREELWDSIFSDGTLQDMSLIVIKLYQEVFSLAEEQAEELQYSPHTIHAIKYIRKHYMEPIGLADVAEAISVNKSYLSRIFRSDLSVGFSDYLNQYRINQSQKIIQDGKYQIKEIARLVGFNHDTYFIKVFKKYTGETPQAFENKMRVM